MRPAGSWTVILALLAVLSLAGVTTLPRQGEQDETKATVDTFVHSVIANDLNALAQATGTTSTNTFRDAWGAATAEIIRERTAAKTNRPEDYRWEIQPLPENRVHLELWMQNHEAIAAKANEFMGFIFDEDGTLLTPEDQIPLMPEADALKRAENDPTIHPLHYRVPLHLLRVNNRLVVDPNDPGTWAVLTLVRRGTLTAEHDQYEVK